MKFKTGCHKCFSALSVAVRVEIVQLLQKSPRLSVSEIVGHFSLAQPTVTHHLKYLKKSGILISRKEGRHVYYYLSPLCGKNKCKIF